MIAWLLYALLVTLALSAAALAAEHAARVRGVATRWAWVASLFGSLVLPAMIAWASIPLSSAPQASIALRDATSLPIPVMLLDLGGAREYATAATLDTLVRNIWMAMAALMALLLATSSVRLHRRRRGWSEGHLCAEHVLVAPDAGPAVVGLLRSRIVVPAWLLQASVEQQQCAMAHERSHLDARDPQLVALALAVLLLMPWNLLLWWQFRRLRRAIEVDCDARVLRDGHDIGAYCDTLIQVGQHQSERFAVVSAMSDSVSFLELRLRHMLRKPQKWAHALAMALLLVALAMAAVAAQMTPPPDIRAATTASGGNTLARYAGFYRISPVSLVTVTRAGNGLVVSISAQIAAPEPFHITATGENLFTVTGRDATVRFVTDADGRPLRLVAHQNGRQVLDAPRINQADADRINAALAARIKAQTPHPGSENALRLLLSDPDGGTGMSADLARVRTLQKASRETYLAELGPVESYAFTGVSRFGSDAYRVKHQHGTETVWLVLDEKGTLASAFRRR